VSAAAETARPGWLQSLIDGIAPTLEVPFSVPPQDETPERWAAVLVLFGEAADGGPDVLLQLRSADMRSHAGQPAFPGGRIDPTDDGPIAAALREAQEETGLDPAGVEVLGSLPELWLGPSGSVVTPVIGWWRVPSDVRAVDPAESEAVARVPIADLVDPANRVMVTHPSGYEAPGFKVADMLVWGFTAGVLTWLLTLAGWDRPWDHSATAVMPGFTLPEPPS
jgi:8-oxo-dGTP pyrophosphatase MutT (NUDIX family)